MHKTKIVLEALMMGMNVQMHEYNVYIGYEENNGAPCLSFMTEEGKLLALCLTVDGFFRRCGQISKKDIIALTMDIALNKARDKNLEKLEIS